MCKLTCFPALANLNLICWCSNSIPMKWSLRAHACILYLKILHTDKAPLESYQLRVCKQIWSYHISSKNSSYPGKNDLLDLLGPQHIKWGQLRGHRDKVREFSVKSLSVPNLSYLQPKQIIPDSNATSQISQTLDKTAVQKCAIKVKHCLRVRGERQQEKTGTDGNLHKIYFSRPSLLLNVMSAVRSKINVAPWWMGKVMHHSCPHRDYDRYLCNQGPKWAQDKMSKESGDWFLKLKQVYGALVSDLSWLC